MKKLILVIAILFFLSGCVQQQALYKQTASGYPEGTFYDMKITEVQSKIIEGCSIRGLIVSQSSSSQVVCEKILSGGQAVLAQIAIGNSYSTTPRQKIRFTMYTSGADVKVTVFQWVETQMAFGQMRSQPLNSNNQRNQIQDFLNSLGADSNYTHSSADITPEDTSESFPSNRGIVHIKYDRITLWSKSGYNGVEVCIIDQSSPLKVLNEKTRWVEVETEAGEKGWISKSWIK